MLASQCVRPETVFSALVTNFDFDLLQQIANLLLSTSVFSIFVKRLVRLSVQYIQSTNPHIVTIHMWRLCAAREEN